MKVKHITRYAILLALAIVVNWVEHLVPLPFVPGVKLGLANAIGILCLYYLGRKAYATFGLLRVLLSSLLFGTFFGTSFWIALGGTILATITTLLLSSYTKSSIYGISMGAAVMHGFGQIIVVSILYQTVYMLSYELILTVTGLISGLLMAYIATLIIYRVPIKVIEQRA